MVTKKKRKQWMIKYLQLEMYSYKKNKKLLESGELSTTQHIHIETVINTIDQALEILLGTKSGELKVKIIKDHYFNRNYMTWEGRAVKFFVHVNSVRNWEYEFFNILSSLLGLTFTF